MKRALIAMFVGFLLMFGSIATTPAMASDNGVDHKVTICHRTNSEKNPYVEITVDKASVVGGHVEVADGHDGHDGPIFAPGMKAGHDKWGDIIPNFDYVVEGKKDNPDTTGTYGGQNYGTAGQALLAAHCEVTIPDEPKPTVTVTVEVPGPTHTVEVPGPTTTVTAPGVDTRVEVPGPTVTVPGPTVTVTTPGERVPVPGPTVTAPGTTKTVTVPGPTETVTETITKTVTEDGEVIREDTVTRGGELPHTGGFNLIAFYLGLALLLGGIVLAGASGFRLTRNR